MPLQSASFEASALFPFFYGLLSEGSSRELQLKTLKIDQDDAFGLLLATGEDTVGSVSVRELR